MARQAHTHAQIRAVAEMLGGCLCGTNQPLPYGRLRDPNVAVFEAERTLLAPEKIAHRANSTAYLVVAQVQLGNQTVIYEKPTGSLDCHVPTGGFYSVNLSLCPISSHPPRWCIRHRQRRGSCGTSMRYRSGRLPLDG